MLMNMAGSVSMPYGKDGKIMGAALGVSEYGGSVSAYGTAFGKDGGSVALLYVDEHGGQV